MESRRAFFATAVMGQSLWANWDSGRALTGFLMALLFPLPFVLAATHYASHCVASASLSVCGHVGGLELGAATPVMSYFVLALGLLYVPMWAWARLPGCNGWLNDLYWTVVPPLALYYFTLVVHATSGLEAHRAGMLWAVVLVWALRLTHNYLRREEYTWGAQEDFRFQRMQAQYGARWWWLSFFAQYLSQHVTETLLCAPYLWVLRTRGPSSLYDTACAALAIACLCVAWVADNELRAFVCDPKSRGQCLTTGVWAYSRHPNYVAESTFHWALALWALQASSPWILVCPAVNSLVLVIAARMKEAHLKSGPRAKAFAEYCTRTRMVL